jgi:hypothetical protein
MRGNPKNKKVIDINKKVVASNYTEIKTDCHGLKPSQ